MILCIVGVVEFKKFNIGLHKINPVATGMEK